MSSIEMTQDWMCQLTSRDIEDFKHMFGSAMELNRDNLLAIEHNIRITIYAIAKKVLTTGQHNEFWVSVLNCKREMERAIGEKSIETSSIVQRARASMSLSDLYDVIKKQNSAYDAFRAEQRHIFYQRVVDAFLSARRETGAA